MTKPIIGIPKALLYYRYNVLWTTFFKKLNCKVITSNETNKELLKVGIEKSIDESCLASKIYIGHVSYLKDKCDYILVPRICDYGKNAKVCVKFNGMYDIIKNTFPNIKLLDYNIEKTKNNTEFKGLFKLGFKITKNPIKILYAYYTAKQKEKVNINLIINKQNIILKNKKLKILIIAHPYIVHDKLIGGPIIEFIKKQNVDILYADRTNRSKSIKNSYKLSKKLYWHYSRELIGSILEYENKINGIIFLTAFPCGPDSLINELLIRKVKNIPIINIIIDELNAETGLQTRLESFIDIIKQKEQTNEK